MVMGELVRVIGGRFCWGWPPVVMEVREGAQLTIFRVMRVVRDWDAAEFEVYSIVSSYEVLLSS